MTTPHRIPSEKSAHVVKTLVLLCLVAMASARGQEVLIDTTFSADKPGSEPIVEEAAGFPMKHPTQLLLSKTNVSATVLDKAEGSIEPPAILVTSTEPGDGGSNSAFLAWGLSRDNLDSGKYELTYTVESLDSSSIGGTMRVDLQSAAGQDESTDPPLLPGSTPVFLQFRPNANIQAQGFIGKHAPGEKLAVKIAFDLDKQTSSLWINEGEIYSDKPFRPNAVEKPPVKLVQILFGVPGGDAAGRFVLGPVKLVRVAD